jgi:hypothetical protein
MLRNYRLEGGCHRIRRTSQILSPSSWTEFKIQEKQVGLISKVLVWLWDAKVDGMKRTKNCEA